MGRAGSRVGECVCMQWLWVIWGCVPELVGFMLLRPRLHRAAAGQGPGVVCVRVLTLAGVCIHV